MRLYGMRTSQKFNIQSLRRSNVPSTNIEMINLGQPLLSVDTRVVAEVDMKVGDYTIAAQPGTARKLTVTHAKQDELDTLGTIEITGTNMLDEVITEVIVPEEDDVVITEKIFKSVTKVEGKGWVIDGVTGTADKIKVGIDDMLGIPIKLESTHQILFAMLGTAIIPIDQFDNGLLGNLGECGIDVSGATYDGTKWLYLLASYNEIYVS